MKTFKKLISILLIATMVIGLATTTYAGEYSNTDGEFPEQEWVGTDEHEEEFDLTGQETSDIQGDGSEYQVADCIVAEDTSYVEVTYIAADDTMLVLSFKNEETSEEVYRREIEVAAGNETLEVEIDASLIPEFFWIDATLAKDGVDVSDVFTCIDRTSEYQEFLNATVDSPEYADNVILDFGEGEDGKDNFAVIKSDVKVVYVESMDDVQVIGDDGKADLFGLMEENDGYVFNDVVNEEILDDIETGDRVLIYPKDDINNARVLTVDTVMETASLFGDEEDDGVAITAAKDESDLENYFELIRLDVGFEVDTDDIDTSNADEGVEVLEEVVDENADEDVADLFKDKTKDTGNKTASKKLSVNKEWSKTYNKNGVNYTSKLKVADTLTVNATVRLVIDYKATPKLEIPYKISKAEASVSLSTTNVFDITATGEISWHPDDWKLGEIPVGNLYGVNFSVPVYFTFSADFGAKFSFKKTKTYSSGIKVTYKSGQCSYKKTKDPTGSSTTEIESEAKVVLRAGIRADFKASFLEVISIAFGSIVGVKITGTVQSINDTKNYRHLDVIACLGVSADIFIRPTFRIKIAGKSIIDKGKDDWNEISFNIWKGYAHKIKSTKKWSYDKGYCKYREYKISFTVKDGKTGKVLSGVTVKETVNGTTKTLGTTDSKGAVSFWLNMDSHTLKFSKSKYSTDTKEITVTGNSSNVFYLYKAGAANDAIVSMNELYNISDEEWATFINEETAAQAGNIGNTIIQVQSAEDLVKLSQFTSRTDRSTAGIKFMLNNPTSALDMNGIDFVSIGTTESPFKGTVDGNSFTISNLSTSLFGYVENAEIHDLTIENAEVAGGSEAAGILACNVTSSKIYDIGIIGGSVSGAPAGGIVGAAYFTDMINSFSTAAVNSSSSAGGIAGVFEFTNVAGRMENVYAAGMVSPNGGGIAGTVPYTSGYEEEEDAVYDVGIKHTYYLEEIASEACASKAEDAEVNVFAVTRDQAKGLAGGEVIAEDDDYANTDSLLGALNNWYAKNGTISSENEEDGGEIPASPNDYFNHWYADSLDSEGNYFNAGCPTFGEKAPVYKLTVEYVYEDSAEAFPTVVMYYTEGQAYDVDTRSIEGFHTYEDSEEYKGNMPAYDLWYRVIFIPDNPYTGTMTELVNSGVDAAQDSSYSIASEEELIMFSEYVNAGKNTSGVTFIQTEEISFAMESGYVSAGTDTNKFKGIFEGQYAGITNLKTNLFGYTDGAKIKAVSVSVDFNDLSSTTMGGIVANAVDTEITNCNVTGSMQGPEATVGGIAGIATDTIIEACTVETGSISGKIAGGIAGTISGGKIINTSNTNFDTDGSEYVGGIAGKATNNALITNCYVTGNVNGSGNKGGIAGSAASAEISNVYYAGTVTDGDAIVKEQGSGLNAESIWYKSGNTSSVSGSKSFTMDESGVQELTDELNGWITSGGMGGYFTWVIPVDEDGAFAEGTTPVFGDLFTNWIMYVDLSNAQFTCTIDDADYPDCAFYIAFYNAGGQMKSMVQASAGSNTFSVANDVVMANAFVMDANMIPMAEVVASR